MCSSILNFSNFVQALVINVAFWSSLNTFIITLTHVLQSLQLKHFSTTKDVPFTTCVTALSSHQDNSVKRLDVQLDAYISKDKLRLCLKWSQCWERDLQSWLYTFLNFCICWKCFPFLNFNRHVSLICKRPEPMSASSVIVFKIRLAVAYTI